MPRQSVPPGDAPAPPPAPGWLKILAGVILGVVVALASIFGVPLRINVAGNDLPIPGPVVVVPTPAPPAPPAPVVVPPPKARRAFGWKRPSAPPPASSRFVVNHLVRASNPPLVDLRPLDIPIWDQGPAGSCTGHGLGAVAAFYWRNGVGPSAVLDIMPSRLAIYFDERAMEGTTCCDEGAAVGDGARVIASIGVAPESLWPYDLSRLSRKPPLAYYAEALKHRVPALVSIDNTSLDEVRTALANQRPIVFGFTVRASFEDVGPDGLYTPSGLDVGGHCVAAMGYDDTRRVVICRNSWGVDWGAKGYFYMPYATFADAATTTDAWCIPSAPIPVPPPIPPPGPPPIPAPGPAPAPTPSPDPVPLSGTLSLTGTVTLVQAAPPTPAPAPPADPAERRHREVIGTLGEIEASIRAIAAARAGR